MPRGGKLGTDESKLRSLQEQKKELGGKLTSEVEVKSAGREAREGDLTFYGLQQSCQPRKTKSRPSILSHHEKGFNIAVEGNGPQSGISLGEGGFTTGNRLYGTDLINQAILSPLE